MTPINYDQFSHQVWDSPLGGLELVASATGLVSIDFVQPAQTLTPAKNSAILDQTIEQLLAYFSGRLQQFSLPFDFQRGTQFQQRVWKALSSIPFGQAISYKSLAELVGSPLAVRAVGGANGKNPIPIIIPCHRVINASGRLGGYSGGLAIKRWLLAHENIVFKE